MRAIRFPWPSVLIIGLMSGTVLLAGGPTTYSQTEMRSGQNTTLPKAVRLVFRGKPGDIYQYQSSGQTQGSRHLQSKISREKRTQLKETSQDIVNLRVRGNGPNNTLLLEVHNLGERIVRTENNKTSRNILPPTDALFTLTPLKQRIHAVPLETAPAKKPTGLSGNTAQPSHADPDTILKHAVSAFNPIPFCDRLLHVGDTWSGEVPANPYNPDTQGAPTMHYTAKLTGIELHRGVPCAKVEYRMACKGEFPGMLGATLKNLPIGSRATGDVQMSGTAITFYTLDRGALLDEDHHLQMTMSYTILVRNPNTGETVEMHLDANAVGEQKQTALKFPAYDSSLISARSTPVSVP